MPKQKVIIDCDPGQDDAINLLLALASPDELEVLGITTVAGNVPLDLSQRNARLMCDVAGRNDVKVYAGCSRPLVRDLVTAEHLHGRTGIDGMALRQPQLGLQLDFFNRHHTAKYGSVGAPLHDPCTIGYLLEPDLFRGKRCNVTVEMGSELTMGCTTVDFWHVTERPKNTNWIHSVNADGFFDLLVERLARFGVA